MESGFHPSFNIDTDKKRPEFQKLRISYKGAVHIEFPL